MIKLLFLSLFILLAVIGDKIRNKIRRTRMYNNFRQNTNIPEDFTMYKDSEHPGWIENIYR